jgi:UDP-glucose 4-epimerase
MEVLVIGGTGFIGSHLVDALAKTNHNVFVIGRHQSKYENGNVRYIYEDYNDSASLNEILKSIDIVYHLVSTTVPTTANSNPKFDIESNLVNTVIFLEKLEFLNIKKIIYISSGGTVYGNAKNQPINENYPLNPSGSYGIVKLAIENYVKYFSFKFNIPFLIIRPSNPYGPRQNYSGEQGVISSFLFNLINNNDLNVWGDGSNIRDYIYISDLIDFIIESSLSKKAGVYNVGFGKGFSVIDIINEIKKITKSKPSIIFGKPKNMDIDKVVLDISRASKTFNWKPKVSLSEGLKLHYDWLRSELNKNNKD